MKFSVFKAGIRLFSKSLIWDPKVSFCDKLLSTECDPCLSWNNIYNFFLARLNGCLEIICDFLVKESEVFLVVKRYFKLRSINSGSIDCKESCEGNDFTDSKINHRDCKKRK